MVKDRFSAGASEDRLAGSWRLMSLISLLHTYLSDLRISLNL